MRHVVGNACIQQAGESGLAGKLRAVKRKRLNFLFVLTRRKPAPHNRKKKPATPRVFWLMPL